MHSSVSLVRCDDYSQETVDLAVRRVVDLLGGLGRFLERGERVLLKPNLLIDAPPEECVTTDPAVVIAIGKLIRSFGCKVIIADSPGSFLPYTHETLTRTYSRTGMLAAARELGVPVNLDIGFKELEFRHGRSLKRFKAIVPAVECDAIVVISKLKTHLATGMTGGAKNIYGIVPGLEKKAVHARFRDPRRFADALVDINERMRPRLQIMDAVMAMEGDGPTSGRPRAVKAILAGGSPYAVDAVAARLMHLDPMRVTTLQAAVGRKLVSFEDIRVAGDSVEAMSVPDFALPCTFTSAASGSEARRTAASVIGRLNLDRARPVVSARLCRGCGACARCCPAEAIRIENGRAVIDRKRCIECYCCHEMCTSKAIELHKGLAGRILGHVMSRTEAES